jgi:F-type H+-transporting ATPase subunit b
MRDEVTAMGEAFEKSLNDARLAGASGGDQIRREAEASERQMLDAARKDALQTLESIRAEIASETDEARNSLNSQSNDLAKVAANKILGRQVSA